MDFIIDLVIWLSTAAIIAIPLLKDIVKRTKQNRYRNVFSKISRAGWIFLAVVVINAVFVAWKSQRDKDEKTNDRLIADTRHTSDTTVMGKMSRKLDSLGFPNYPFGGDSNLAKKIIKGIDSSFRSKPTPQEFPLLVWDTKTADNPLFVKVGEKRYDIQITIKNEGKGLARKMGTRTTFVYKNFDGRMTSISDTTNLFPNSEVLPSGGGYTLNYHLADVQSIPDTFFVITKIFYQSESGKTMQPFVEAFKGNPDRLGKSLFLVNRSQYEVLRKYF